jgi:DNA-binding NarL/FixJ family response regulator
MLVDDNPTFLRIAARYLATSYPDEIALVGTAGRTEEALELAARLLPDALATDLAMPGLSGLALIERLRTQRPDVALVALTVHDDEAHRQAALAAGADGFVGKANLGTDLVPTLLRAARSRRSQPEVRRGP